VAVQPTAVVETRGLTKSFPGILAVDDVELEIRAGDEPARGVDVGNNSTRASVSRDQRRRQIDLLDSNTALTVPETSSPPTWT
jgi:hypothetical protein